MAKPAGTLHPFFSEKAILFPVLLLCGIGIIMVYSASSSIGMEEHDSAFFYMKKQVFFFCISLCVMFVTASFPHKLYQSFSYFILFAAILLLVAVLFPALSI